MSDETEMPQWIQAVTTVIALGASAFVFIKALGRDEGINKEWRLSVEDRFDRHDSYHKDHYKHLTNSDIHWTTRERDALNHRLDNQDSQLDEILNAVRDLDQNRNGRQ